MRWLVIAVAAVAACSGGGMPRSPSAGAARGEGGGGGAPTSGPVPAFGHVIVVVEENADYKAVIGTSAMPYLNQLAHDYGLATQYYAVTHPSIGNYFMLTVGKIITNNDDYASVVNEDNIVRRLVAAGISWKAYAEDLPAVGYTGPDVGRYARKHNVIALLSDVADDPVQRQHLVAFSQFTADLAADRLPAYAFVIPNLCNDAHDCPLATADGWLEANIDPLVQSPTFQADGLLVIVFDESGTDNTNGGGRIACVIVSAKARRGYRSPTLYTHASLLRLTAEALGLTTFPNAAATAPRMAEFFAPTGTP